MGEGGGRGRRGEGQPVWEGGGAHLVPPGGEANTWCSSCINSSFSTRNEEFGVDLVWGGGIRPGGGGNWGRVTQQVRMSVGVDLVEGEGGIGTTGGAQLGRLGKGQQLRKSLGLT